jgi:hypothetical protein
MKTTSSSKGRRKRPTGAVHRLRGILKRPPGEKSLAQAMAEYKQAEKELEDGAMEN